eukprot:NODE_15_length_50561_cov_0.608081.p19 type:complete len:332 gc:universal NODE_15_length_50561_cov_0.608081:5414-4419(-)
MTKEDDFTYHDFELLNTLGTGTFGRVYLTRIKPSAFAKPTLSPFQYYALKVLQKKTIVKLRQVEHIRNEKMILEKLKHPLIVNLLYHFQSSANLYLIMEYIPGGELFSHLRKAGRFNLSTSVFYAAQLTTALGFLHDHGCIYRDLKPENLLLNSKGNLKLCDFGFAKFVPEGDVTYTLCGTAEYLAPEIIKGKGHTKAVDWYALGILIYEFLVGYPPFYDESPFGIYEKILRAKLIFPAQFHSPAKDLIRQLLTHDLTNRIGNLRNGTDDIKNHLFFAQINWLDVENLKLTPPIVPHLQHPGDSSYFDHYPEEKTKHSVQEDIYHDLFVDF